MGDRMTERIWAVPIDQKFGDILCCAVRYALGRETYMPYRVTEYIRPIVSKLDDNTLYVLERDIATAQRYGDPNIDEPLWRCLLVDIKAEREKRRQAIEREEAEDGQAEDVRNGRSCASEGEG